MRLYIRTKQERGPQAGFSVCGKVTFRPMKIPAKCFLCHRVQFPITKIPEPSKTVWSRYFCIDRIKHGAYGIRTHGLNNANVARSQLR